MIPPLIALAVALPTAAAARNVNVALVVDAHADGADIAPIAALTAILEKVSASSDVGMLVRVTQAKKVLPANLRKLDKAEGAKESARIFGGLHFRSKTHTLKELTNSAIDKLSQLLDTPLEGGQVIVLMASGADEDDGKALLELPYDAVAKAVVIAVGLGPKAPTALFEELAKKTGGRAYHAADAAALAALVDVLAADLTALRDGPLAPQKPPTPPKAAEKPKAGDEPKAGEPSKSKDPVKDGDKPRADHPPKDGPKPKDTGKPKDGDEPKKRADIDLKGDEKSHGSGKRKDDRKSSKADPKKGTKKGSGGDDVDLDAADDDSDAAPEADAEADAEAKPTPAKTPMWVWYAASGTGGFVFLLIVILLIRRGRRRRRERAAEAAPAPEAAGNFDASAYFGGRAAAAPAVVTARFVPLLADFDGFDLASNVGPLSLGRKAGNDIVLQHRGVSGQHAELRWADGQLVLTDRGSTNGTFVNDTRIQQQVLRAGDVIRFDAIAFRVGGETSVSGGGSQQPAAAEGGDKTMMLSADDPMFAKLREDPPAPVIEEDEPEDLDAPVAHCLRHKRRVAQGPCDGCGRPYCSECLVLVLEEELCPRCRQSRGMD